MQTPNDLQELAKAYSDSAAVRAIVQLVPSIGGAFDTALAGYADHVRRERAEELFRALSEDRFDLTDDIIHSEDFLHKCWVTYSAAMRTRQREKIRRLARLLSASTRPLVLTSIDEYEELERTIEELTEREFQLLLLLREHEQRSKDEPHDNDLARIMDFWPRFAEAAGQIGIRHEEVTPMLTSISRTGCFLPITGTYLNYSGGMGHTTAKFERLITVLKDGASRV